MTLAAFYLRVLAPERKFCFLVREFQRVPRAGRMTSLALFLRLRLKFSFVHVGVACSTTDFSLPAKEMCVLRLHCPGSMTSRACRGDMSSGKDEPGAIVVGDRIARRDEPLFGVTRFAFPFVSAVCELTGVRILMTIAAQLEFGHGIPASNGLPFLLDLRMTLDALHRRMFTFEREAGEGMIE